MVFPAIAFLSIADSMIFTGNAGNFIPGTMGEAGKT